MAITLAEALAVLITLRNCDMLTADEQKVMKMSWDIITAEAERIIREATTTPPA